MTGNGQSEVSLVPLASLAVDVITDDVSDNYVSKTLFAVSEFANVVRAGATALSGEALLCANLGFGCRLVSSAGGVRHTLLFDTGPEGAIFIRNCANLGVALGEVEAIAVSHGHWDHMAALPATLDAIRARGRQRPRSTSIPACSTSARSGSAAGPWCRRPGSPPRPRSTALGAAVVNDPAARLLLDRHFYLSGEIPRVSAFEKGRVDHLSRTGPDAAWQPDPLLLDERMLVVHIRDLGLVVVSSCSHAGIVNVCTEVGRLFPDIPIHCVIGGLHLGGVMERLIPRDGRGAAAIRDRAHHHRPLHRLAGLACAGQRLWRRGQPIGGRHQLRLSPRVGPDRGRCDLPYSSPCARAERVFGRIVNMLFKVGG